MKKKIILYNPIAPYYTLPLQFLALASMIDKARFDVVIVDARLERSAADAHRKVIEQLPDALCVGVSVITGIPIKDALELSRKVKHHAPNVPTIWGGWHPSIYPEQSLREAEVDYCVFGQGEATFAELIESIDSRSGLENVQGISYLLGGDYVSNGVRKFIDINELPAYDYSLLPLEDYFSRKGIRQLDFYSSQGCPYRCAFCADPFVYGRRWSGLKGSRLLFDVFEPVTRFKVKDVIFQDENFFANRGRVLSFCQGMREHAMDFTWVATSRADQIAPLDEGFLSEAKHAHLRKVIIGAESGSQEMLDFMKKDTLVEETIISAEKLASQGIGATFNFIVGFPEENFDETRKTLETVKQVKRINPDFEFGIFFFTPYPGTDLFDYIQRKGFRTPTSLSEWSDLDFVTYAGYWISNSEKEYIDRFKFYARAATENSFNQGLRKPIRHLARSRLKRDFYAFPIEQSLVDFVRYNLLDHPRW